MPTTTDRIMVAISQQHREKVDDIRHRLAIPAGVAVTVEQCIDYCHRLKQFPVIKDGKVGTEART